VLCPVPQAWLETRTVARGFYMATLFVSYTRACSLLSEVAFLCFVS
jgi:hypothetical protein